MSLRLTLKVPPTETGEAVQDERSFPHGFVSQARGKRERAQSKPPAIRGPGIGGHATAERGQ